ncbi:hypothetical protein ACPEEZ_10355 [Frigoribacterium sp. 2-23]|uniref:hypothetical protein n=1 Tax=Frigoribacterium sp. 2-23 TaxID=3415006 RepID=UPI003C6F180B
MKRTIAMLAAVVVVASGFVGIGASVSAPSAQALSGAEFDPGNIISDAVFFNGGAMSEAQIQSFLDSQIGACTNGNCLNVLRLDTSTRGADAMCASYQGAGGESVARIISKVSAVCGINPQVILVTLQKEQSLVNGSIARGPSTARLERAMGYACPDSANGGCDPTYAGVYNQIYRAAWQFKRYGNPPGTSNYFTQYAPGTTKNVLYNPNAACGTKSVAIRNQATANLYYYTPYTPNAAALANLNGNGDGCSAFGNRNFWVYFNNWFGSPTGTTRAIGAVDALSAGIESVSVRGWALDPSSTASIQVHAYVGSAGTPISADRQRPDVGRAYPANGSAHGFDATFSAAPGLQKVCVYAIGLGSAPATELVCQMLDIKPASPFGAVDVARAVPGGIEVSGWAIDLETTDPIQVHVYVDNAGRALTADRDRPDVGRAWPASGSAHGFAGKVPASPGVHTVCIYGINVARGSNSLVGPCRAVTVPGSKPIGSLDVVTVGQDGVLTAKGWALDGDTTDPIATHVYVDGRPTAVRADQSRSDIARVYPAYGAAHGYTASVKVGYGTHSVCAYGINVGSSDDNALLGCTSVTVSNAVPLGSLDGAVGVAGGIAVNGWAWDPDTSAPIQVHVYVEQRGYQLTADGRRDDVARAHPAAGAEHGFSGVVPAPAGSSQNVCVYAIDSTGGENPTIGCRLVAIPR